MQNLTLQQQADKILELAQKRGVSSNFFFVTTFKRYQVQMKILSSLEEAIAEHGSTVEKTYVKDRANLSVNPAIIEYNKTTSAANGTVSTLINIIKSFGSDEEDGSVNVREKFQEFMEMLSDETVDKDSVDEE